jgi:hypothetical protein
MDFPTALRYLLAGNTIRRESLPDRIYRLGTIYETLSPPEKKRIKDGPEIVELWLSSPDSQPIVCSLYGWQMLATDWELVE